MATEAPNLWPDDLTEEISEASPFAILKDQAAQLYKATQYKLRGRVSRTPGPYTHGFSYEFAIEVPKLEYAYDLFWLVQKQLDFYPLEWRFEAESGEIASENELYAWLKWVFSSDKTRLVVKRLIAQANA